MNIFILNKDPVLAAQEQCDKHVVKMIVESGQMLSTAHRMLDGSQTRRRSKSGKTMSKYWVLDDDREDTLYKAVHMGHPCTVWTMESAENYKWHYEHFVALCAEYQHRYSKVHATQKLLEVPLKRMPNRILHTGRTPYALAMGAEPQCINHDDPVKSYKDFYITKQKRFKMVWSKRATPAWFA